jgi:guanylate kinase
MKKKDAIIFSSRLSASKRWSREGAFIEHQEVHSGKFYGTPYRELHDGLRQGAHLIADIDIRGTTAIRAIFLTI